MARTFAYTRKENEEDGERRVPKKKKKTKEETARRRENHYNTEEARKRWRYDWLTALANSECFLLFPVLRTLFSSALHFFSNLSRFL